MQSDDQAGSARRPKATIEGNAREVSATRPDTPESEPTKPNEPQSSSDDTEQPPSLIERWLPLVAPAAIGAAIAIVTLVAIVVILRFGSETTARAVRVVTGAETPASEVAALTEQVGALRARLSTLERLEDRVGDLARRADALEQAAAAAADRAESASSENTTRIENLEGRFAAVDSATLETTNEVEDLRREIAAAAESGASAAAVATRLTRESTRLDAVESQLRGIEQNLSSLSGAAANAAIAAEGARTAQEQLTRRLAALEDGGAAASESSITDRLDRMQARVDALSLPAVLAAHNALVAKAEAGEDFGRETAALATQLGDAPELAPIEQLSDRPVPTIGMLARRLTDLGSGDGNTNPPQSEDNEAPSGWFGRLLDRASEAVQVRRIDGASASPDMTRAQEMLDDGDIAAATAIVATLPRSDARDRWLDDARARRELDRALAELGTTIDARIASAKPASSG